MVHKIISYILIQAFICLDLFIVGAIAKPVDMSTLAPAMMLNKVDLQIVFDEINAKNKNEEYDLLKDINLNEDAEVADIEEDKDELEQDYEMSAFDSTGDGQSAGASFAGQGGISNTGAGDIGSSPKTLPPPDTDMIQSVTSNISRTYAVNRNEDLEDGSDITNQQLMDEYDLALEDIGFKQNLVDVIVRDNSSSFDKVIWALPHKLSKDEPNRMAQGPFRVLANTRAQNAVDLAASGFTIGMPLDQILAKMVTVFSFSEDVWSRKYEEIIKVLHATASAIHSKGRIELSDVYFLATKLVADLKQIEVKAVDEGPNRKRALWIRSHLVPSLRKEYAKNPENMIKYLKFMVLLHEEGHTLPMGVLAHHLKWPAFKTKETALNIFRKLILGDWPSELQNLGFLTIINRSEYRTQADVIMQSQWLYGYNPLKKDFKDAYWKEAIANYYAFLKLVEKENGDDSLAIESLALGTHYSIQLNPPNEDYLEVNLVDTINSFFPFLNKEQSDRWMKKVLSLQLEGGALKHKASVLLKSMDTLKTVGGGKLYSLAIPAVFTSSAVVNQANIPSPGDMQYWIIAAAVVVGVSVGAWLWNKLPWGKSTEQRTEQLVNKAVKQHAKDAQNINLINLQKFYNNLLFRKQGVIINTIRAQILSKPNKIDSTIFEPFFKNILEFGPKTILQNMQSIVYEKMKFKNSDSLRIPVVLMDSRVVEVLKIYNERSLPQDRVDVNAVSLRLAELVVNLAARNMLHDKSVFVQSLLNNAAGADYINAAQADKLYTVIVDGLPNSFISKNEFASKIVEKELKKLKARIDAKQVAIDITPHLTLSLSHLQSTVKADGFSKALLASSKSLRESSLENNQLYDFLSTIDEKLINGVAMRLAFSDSFFVINSEIEKLGLGIDVSPTTLALFPAIARAGFFDNADIDYEALQGEAAYQIFYRKLENETDKLKFFAVSALEDFSTIGQGTAGLVAYLKEYLRTEGTNISFSLKDRISVVVETLSDKDVSVQLSNRSDLAVKSVQIQNEMPLQSATRRSAKKESRSGGEDVLKAAPELVISSQSSQRRFVNSIIIESAI